MYTQQGGCNIPPFVVQCQHKGGEKNEESHGSND